MNVFKHFGGREKLFLNSSVWIGSIFHASFRKTYWRGRGFIKQHVL